MKPFVNEPDVLTSELARTIDEIVVLHDSDPHELIPILLELQQAVERKYIPIPASLYVAEKLGLKPTQVYDVISFYTALHAEPRAQYPLEVCDSAPCRVNDADALVDTLKRLLNLELGDVTYDGRFSIEKVPCFGACDVAPAVRVNGVVYGSLNSEEAILAMLRQLD